MQNATPPPAVPIEPIGAILAAFDDHQVVALDEGTHGSVEGHAFRLALVRDPRLATRVQDIVVEFGNARYQESMDRFVRGDYVPAQTLRQVWQNTTNATPVWDVPIYEDFFRAVRTVNATLPRAQQLRVLLGDPPIDWARVHSSEDHFRWLADRDSFPADLIQREVLGQQRRALVIYGALHLMRHGLAETLVSRLETAASTDPFTIFTSTSTTLRELQTDVTSWPMPSLALVRDTTLGATQFSMLYPTFEFNRRDGQTLGRPLRLDEQFDAVLTLGQHMTMATLPEALCADTNYREMRRRRMALTGQPRLMEWYCTNRVRNP